MLDRRRGGKQLNEYMSILIYNTLTRKKEEFKPIDDNLVSIYVCGLTPYDEVHLGHARAYVAFDVIRRYLELSGFKVKSVQNFTDIDDKIIRRAREKNVSPKELSEHYIIDYFSQMDKLNVKRADAYPKVTENIPQIIQFIEQLIKKSKAYAVDGDVYFSVRNFKSYGKLSGRNPDELKSGARIDVDERKNDPLDFALWKKSKPDEPADVSWNSPWGKGRPGWHIECSVMSTSLLGQTIDIHGGGQDLIFPHHENEIAQSEAATGKPFVHYWVHNGFVTINQDKMSKSLGNFFSLREIFEKYDPRVVRYFLLSQHYRSPLDFSDDKLRAAQSALAGIDELYMKLSEISVPSTAPSKFSNLAPNTLDDIIEVFRLVLNDDFNTEKALAVIHELKKDVLSTLRQKSPGLLHKAFVTLNILLQDYLGITAPQKESLTQEILELKSKREKVRNEKNWAEADNLRRRLDSLGYKVEDNPNGSSTILKK